MSEKLIQRDLLVKNPVGDAALTAKASRGLAEFAQAATSDNTRRTYQSVIRTYLAQGGRLPCGAADVINYLVGRAAELNPRSLYVIVSALSKWHVSQGFPDPTKDVRVKTALKGNSRINGRPKQKAPALSVNSLKEMVLPLQASSALIDLRDRALLLVAYFGSFRRSEVCGLQLADIQFVPEGLLITLPKSKTDQEGQGIVKGIRRASKDPSLCPAKALETWCDASGIEEGPVFRRINRWGQLGEAALSTQALTDVIQRAAKAAGIADYEDLSGHSLRRGLATSAYAAGASFRAIKKQGGWKSDSTVSGYIEEAAIFEDNVGSVLY